MTNSSANHEARTEIAVLTAQVEALTRETRGYHDEVREYRQENQARQKVHSRRLDEFALALAELKRAQQTADKALEEVDALKREQRWWTGTTTLLAALAGFLGLRD